MSVVSDTLYILSAISLRGQFVEKALIYGKAGIALFPQDVRLFETYAYALLLSGRDEEAASVLNSAPEQTRNVVYLKARTALTAGAVPKSRDFLRSYLELGRSS